MQIDYIHEPTDLQCGQAVLAMLTQKSVDEICKELNNYRETTLKEMKNFLTENNIKFENDKKSASTKEDLPCTAMLSLETPRCWHWSLYHNGVFYDPEHGVMDDFPTANRKFFWKIELE